MLLLDKLTVSIYHIFPIPLSILFRKNKRRAAFIQLQLIKGCYQFSPMFRTWIPKTKNPKELRPITKPAGKDRLVLEAMTFLLNEMLEPIFLDQSHGFRRKRGAKTFFRTLSNWPEMECIIKCDVRHCFDNISHNILLKTLRDHLGQENLPFISLIDRFLKTEILDRKGNNYACSEVGIPQGREPCFPYPNE